MLAVLYVLEKIPRPLLIPLALLFLFTLIVGLGHTTDDHRSTQEKHHGYNHSSAR